MYVDVKYTYYPIDQSCDIFHLNFFMLMLIWTLWKCVYYKFIN